jgi:hypothetical protein
LALPRAPNCLFLVGDRWDLKRELFLDLLDDIVRELVRVIREMKRALSCRIEVAQE